MISKETFIDVMNELIKADAYQTDLNKFFKNHDVDGYIFQPDCATSVVSLLHEVFKKDEDNIISKFCFEYEFGSKWKKEDTDKFGHDISTPELLYDYLVRC